MKPHEFQEKWGEYNAEKMRSLAPDEFVDKFCEYLIDAEAMLDSVLKEDEQCD
jgi:hypothetical protein